MKCTNCDGRGAVQIAPNVKGLKRCPVCDGSGEVSQILQTNEEWFCSLSTEEKAEFLAKKCCEISCKFFLGEAEEIFSRYWVEWLKQPHTTIKE